MEFQGAVKVSNARIRKACDNHELEYNRVWTLIKGLDKRAEEAYKGLGWFSNVWHSPDEDFMRWCTDGTSRETITYCRSVTNWYSGFRRAYITLEWLTEEDYSLYESGKGQRNTLLALINCGEPVYLNPSQANWVNLMFDKGE